MEVAVVALPLVPYEGEYGLHRRKIGYLSRGVNGGGQEEPLGYKKMGDTGSKWEHWIELISFL